MIIQGLYALIFGSTPTFDNPTVTNQNDALLMILEGLGLGTLRAGVTKVGGA